MLNYSLTGNDKRLFAVAAFVVIVPIVVVVVVVAVGLRPLRATN